MASLPADTSLHVPSAQGLMPQRERREVLLGGGGVYLRRRARVAVLRSNCMRSLQNFFGLDLISVRYPQNVPQTLMVKGIQPSFIRLRHSPGLAGIQNCRENDRVVKS